MEMKDRHSSVSKEDIMTGQAKRATGLSGRVAATSPNLVMFFVGLKAALLGQRAPSSPVIYPSSRGLYTLMLGRLYINKILLLHQ